MDIVSRVSHTLNAWMAVHADLNTIKKVSVRSGVGFGTVQRAKNGDGNITVKNLELIARAFHRPVEDLLGLAQTASNVVIMPTVREPEAPYSVTLKQLMDTAQGMSERGQEELLAIARALASLHPAAKANHVN